MLDALLGELEGVVPVPGIGVVEGDEAEREHAHDPGGEHHGGAGEGGARGRHRRIADRTGCRNRVLLLARGREEHSW